MPEDSPPSYIGFRTDLVWTAGEVVDFFTSVSGLYNAFLALRIRDDQQMRYFEAMERHLEAYIHWCKRHIDGPLYGQFLYMYLQLLRDWKESGYRFLPPLPFVLPFPPAEMEAQRASVWDMYKNIELYAPESDMLQVHRIRMSSPEGFSFRGIGEVVKELREFVKDIWYRNKQEKDRGRLQLIQQYLKVRRKFPEAALPPLPTTPTERKLIKTVDGHVENLFVLEQRGKLLNVSEHMDYKPGPSKK